MVHMHRVICNFPSFIRDWVVNDYSKRVTFSFNFIQGSQNPHMMAGCKSISQGFMGTAMGTQSGNISVLSHCKKLKISLTADRAAIPNTELLMELIYENLDDILGQ